MSNKERISYLSTMNKSLKEEVYSLRKQNDLLNIQIKNLESWYNDL